MGKISNGWALTKQSFSVINSDKEILLFSIFSAIFQFALLALFFGFIIFWWFGSIFANLTIEQVSPNLSVTFLIVSIVIFIFLNQFISAFFESAIITSAIIRFSKRNPSFFDGLSRPISIIHKIIFFSLISTLVNILLRIIGSLIKSKKTRGSELLSNVTTSILGLSWSILSFYVLPIILFEELSVFKSISRSWHLFKKTWGENIVSQFSIAGIFMLISIPFIGLFILAIVAKINILIIISIILLLILFVLSTIISSTVLGILKAALYCYAVTNELPQVYDRNLLNSLFSR